MGAWLNDSWNIILAIAENDAFTLSEALRAEGTWLLGLIVTLLGGSFIMALYRFFPWCEKNLEKNVMIVSYLLIGGIIFVEVIRRFVFSVQAPWSTTIPPYLFLVMTWIGCAYNVKLRTHLSFSEFRSRLSPPLQFLCLSLDAMLWTGFSWVIIVTSLRVVVNSSANFQILPGTNDILQWWFLLFVPISFFIIVGRTMNNYREDWQNLKAGRPLITTKSIAGD